MLISHQIYLVKVQNRSSEKEEEEKIEPRSRFSVLIMDTV